MNSRLTLLFVNDQPHLYLNLLAEFRSANFQVLIARKDRQAKAVIRTRSVNAIILLHDVHGDDRVLAPQLKRITPGIPIFLFTDYPQPLPAAVDSVWRYKHGDAVVAHSMAVFCRNLFKPTPEFRGVLAPRAVASAFTVSASKSN